ncbi:MAG TPA: hypothetical protein VKA46_17865 [Gemmataceae bacterium]|nr:hypothetical protein [Gemmataceae bacterium]
MRTIRIVALALTPLLLAARPAPAGERSPAQAVIERAIEAAGGEARLGRFKAAEWTCKGTAHASTALAFTDRCFAQWPEKFRHESSIEVRGQTIQRSLILDVGRGWIKGDGGTVTMNDTALAELRDKVHVLRLAATLLPLKEKGVTLDALEEIKIDDRRAAGVKATCADRPDLRLYFDKDTGLLLKCERTVKDALGGEAVSEETFFSDYHEVEGVQVARKVSVKRGGKPFLDWTVSDFQVRAKLDPGLFTGP